MYCLYAIWYQTLTNSISFTFTPVFMIYTFHQKLAKLSLLPTDYISFSYPMSTINIPQLWCQALELFYCCQAILSRFAETRLSLVLQTHMCRCRGIPSVPTVDVIQDKRLLCRVTRLILGFCQSRIICCTVNWLRLHQVCWSHDQISNSFLRAILYIGIPLSWTPTSDYKKIFLRIMEWLKVGTMSHFLRSSN